MPQPYPHLLPEEVRIWDKFLAQYGPLFVNVEYDVHVGPGAPIPEGASESYARQIRAVSRFRLDAVVTTPSEIWIVEIKPRGGNSAVGQLINYELWYKRENPVSQPLVKVLVCERLAPGIEQTCNAAGIRIYLV